MPLLDPHGLNRGWQVLAFTISAKVVGLLYSEELMLTALPFGAVLVWCRLLKFLHFSQPIGVLTIMILEMMQDIALWILVMGIFTAAFTVAFLASGDLLDGTAHTAHALNSHCTLCTLLNCDTRALRVLQVGRHRLNGAPAHLGDDGLLRRGQQGVAGDALVVHRRL
jgi:hypothetical protein